MAASKPSSASPSDADGRDSTGDRIQATRSDPWLWIAGLLLATFVVRALLYLSILPPLEGWDEYQHLGYIIYLDEQRQLPVLNQAILPESMHGLLRSLPLPRGTAEQSRFWGTRNYDEFWNQSVDDPPAQTEPLPSISLYQAQHPPLAYLLALPFWRAMGASDPVAAIFAIRALNVLFVTGALAFFAWALRSMITPLAPRTAVLALICLHPLFLQNTARVANDALAIAAAIVALSALATARRDTLMRRGAIAAIFVAFSIWSKQTGLVLAPALCLSLPLIAQWHGATPRRTWQVTGVAVAIMLLLVAPLWIWSWQHYGSIITTQESVQLAARGAGDGSAYLGAAQELRWTKFLTKMFVPGTPWVGGWSFLRPQGDLTYAYDWLMILLISAAVVGYAFRFIRKRAPRLKPPSIAGTRSALTIGALVSLTTAAGMIHHALTSHALYGQSTTSAWYFMTALPFFLLLLVCGLDAMNRRGMIIGAVLLAVLLIAIELHGTLIRMPPVYAATEVPELMWSRLGEIHPAFPHPAQRGLFITLEIGLLLALSVGLLKTGRRSAIPT